MKPTILKLGENWYVRADMIASVQQASDVLFVTVGNDSLTLRPESHEAKVVLDWFAENLAERLEDANDGDLQEIQTEAHDAGILTDAIIAKCIARRTSRQLPF